MAEVSDSRLKPAVAWLQILPCGCQDVHYSDGSTDREHDHVQCDGSPQEGAPLFSEPTHGAMGRVAFVTEWYTIPPERLRGYRVTSDYWRDGNPPVREIHGWEYTRETG